MSCSLALLVAFITALSYCHGTWGALPPPQSAQHCTALFGSRREMTASEATVVASRLKESAPFCPALLWTYTGTGNTMTRMLIEVASGWYTGSLYTDLSLVDILPGEYLCGPSVIAVKAHPQWHPYSSIRPDGIRPAVPNEPPDAKEVCPSHFTRAVAVTRDPYATFLAEYKRLRTHDYSACSLAEVEGKACVGGHVSVINRADFNRTDFRHEVTRMAHEWVKMFKSYDEFQAAYPGGFYLTTFESITTDHTKMQALAGILAALGVPPPYHQDSSPHDSSEVEATCQDEQCQQPGKLGNGPSAANDLQGLHGYDPDTLECAFAMAKHPQIYRTKDPTGIDDAYVYASDKRFVCDVWHILGVRARQHGYSPYGAVDCP